MDSDSYFFLPEHSLKMDFCNYGFDESLFDNINIKFDYEIKMTDDILEYNEIWDDIDDSFGNRNDTHSYLKNTKTSFEFEINIILGKNMSTTCNDEDCALCLKENLDYCIVCKDDNYTTINDKIYGKLKICRKLKIEDLINGNYENISLSSENIKNIYEELKQFLEEEYGGNNILINTSNVKIQISNLENQIISNDLSEIDLGECKDILKKKYCRTENDSLILLKFDIKLDEENSTYVKYDIYGPDYKTKINLNECPNINLIMNIPIEFEPDIESIYEMLSKDGYNLFDEKDSFYNDICATYTNDKGTDVLLSDRRTDFYQKTINISLCQEGCELQSYDKVTKKAKCECPIQDSKIENIELSELKFDKNKMISEFQKILDNSNFRVLKCYELIFKSKLFVNKFWKHYYAHFIIIIYFINISL